MSKSHDNLSRAISHALRHEPWLYELEIDEEGWADIGALLTALRQELPAWRNLEEHDLAAMIRSSSKQRHELASGRIRALYGHSIPGKLSKTPAAPPTCLFHGTSPASVAAIRNDGLLPMARQYVHLSIDRETAMAVGRRKSPYRRRIVKRCGGDKHRMFRWAKRVESAHKTRVTGFETSGGSRGE